MKTRSNCLYMYIFLLKCSVQMRTGIPITHTHTSLHAVLVWVFFLPSLPPSLPFPMQRALLRPNSNPVIKSSSPLKCIKNPHSPTTKKYIGEKTQLQNLIRKTKNPKKKNRPKEGKSSQRKIVPDSTAGVQGPRLYIPKYMRDRYTSCSTSRL